MEEERDEEPLRDACQMVIAVVILLLFIGTIVLAILYKELQDMDEPFREALALIRQFVEKYDPSAKGKDDFAILAVAQNLSNHLVTWADRNDELHTEIRYITKLLKTWKFFRRSLYYFAPEKVMWQTAFEECKKENTSLVTVRIGEEQAFIDMEVRKRNQEHWIGLRRNDSLPFRVYWIDGLKVSRTYWDYDEPTPAKDTQSPQECVLIGTGCKIQQCWHDRTCSQLHHYICKKEPNKKWDS